MGRKWDSTKVLWLAWAMTVGWIACGGATSLAHTQTEVVKMYPCPFASEEPTETPQQRSVGSLIQALQGVGWKITALSPDLSSLSVRACAGQNRPPALMSGRARPQGGGRSRPRTSRRCPCGLPAA